MNVALNPAAAGYASAKPATQPNPDEAGQSAIGQAFQDFATTLQQGEQTAIAAMSGDADPHALVQALAQTELAVEAVVTVRDKVVEAYQEILNMPV